MWSEGGRGRRYLLKPVGTRRRARCRPRESELATNRARSSTKRTLTVTEAKAKVIAAIRDGVSVRDAMATVDRAEATYVDWLKNDDEFRKRVDQVRAVARAARARGGDGKHEVPDFPEFCELYLNQALPEHHLRIWDVLNGDPPRNMHPSIRHQVGRPNRVLVNMPPFHAKTQVWSAQYALWRLVKDPNVRIAIVSKTQDLAKKILYQITQYLVLPQYAGLQAAFMPEGGWKGDSWTKTAIYLAGVDSGHKDPSLQALGLGGQIYGSRLDVVILDDLIDMKNVHDYKAIADYVGTEVDSRVDDDGVLHVLGTRFAANDLYSELRDLTDYDGETPVWTWFAQPAVLEMPETDPNTWVTLWPFKNDGSPMWDGVALARKKAVLPTQSRWDLTFQQLDADVDQVFPSGAVMASIDGRRATGPIEGLYTVLGVDPAANGFTAMTVMGLDRATGQRFILDGFNMARCPPDLFMSTMRNFITRYKIREAVLETNAVQGFIARQADFKDFCYANGCLISEHITGGKKWDPDLGVSSMAPWFLSCAEYDKATDTWHKRPVDKHLISLPNPKFSSAYVETLINQLTTWQPREGVRSQRTATDTVMSMWFASIGIQKVLDNARNAARHVPNEFLTRSDRRQQTVVNLQELRESQLRGRTDISFYDSQGAA